MNPIMIILIIIIWLYILSVLKRAGLHAWRFAWGSLGLFIIMMKTIQPLLTVPLARCVAAMAGVVGGGGLGDIAIRYGYYRYETGIMIVTIIILVILVQILQGIGMMLSKKLDRRQV